MGKKSPLSIQAAETGTAGAMNRFAANTISWRPVGYR
jgi:hypothetical protein